MKIQSTPLKNIGKTEGIKDIKNDSYSASNLYQIDTAQYEDYGNAQGATSVIRRLTSVGTSYNLPANPTKVTNVTVRNNKTSPVTINPGATATLLAVSTVYDCTTWGTFYSYPSYDYVGYFASSHSKTEETKTFLVQS